MMQLNDRQILSQLNPPPSKQLEDIGNASPLKQLERRLNTTFDDGWTKRRCEMPDGGQAKQTQRLS